MAEPGSVIGWKLDRALRDELLAKFPPRYPDADADHVTLQTKAWNKPLPPDVDATIVGHADDGDSLEAMVVRIDTIAAIPATENASPQLVLRTSAPSATSRAAST